MKDRFSLSSIKENCQLILFLNWVFNSMQPNYKESPLLKPIVILQTELQRSLLAATVPKTTWTSWLFQVHKVLLWSGKSVTQFTKKITRYHFANCRHCSLYKSSWVSSWSLNNDHGFSENTYWYYLAAIYNSIRCGNLAHFCEYIEVLVGKYFQWHFNKTPVRPKAKVRYC